MCKVQIDEQRHKTSRRRKKFMINETGKQVKDRLQGI